MPTLIHDSGWRKSLATHIVFGAGLYVSAMAVRHFPGFHAWQRARGLPVPGAPAGRYPVCFASSLRTGKDYGRMSEEAAHHSWWQTFEAVFAIPFVAAIALQWLQPLALPDTFLMPAIVVGGVALIVAGFSLAVLARRDLSRRAQPTNPGHPTSILVTTGAFSLSRNPLYLGGVCILVGIALALNLPWVLVLLLPSLVAGHFILIVPEERYLAATFPREYATYAANVNRWFGRGRGHSRNA